MAQVFINVGGQANDGTGDSFRQAGTTINNNFTYFYGLESVQSHIGMAENVISSQLSNADIVLKPSGTGNVILGSGITFADNNIITNIQSISIASHNELKRMNCKILRKKEETEE